MNLLSLTSKCLNFNGNNMGDVAVLRSSVMSTEVSRYCGITILRTPGRRYPQKL